jgi:Protein of unknown function (DUF4031)
MTIYVDELHDYGVKYGRAGPEWSHMTTDGAKEELHAFADKLGLKRSYFQDKPAGWHYDLTKGMRAKAVRLGAVEVEGAVWIPQLLAKHRAAMSLEPAIPLTLPTYSAISLTQPWATLMACAAKTIETRSWKPYLKPGAIVAIHAAKSMPIDAQELLENEPFRRVLYAAHEAGFWTDRLPRGAVVALARFQGAKATLGGGIDYDHMREEEYQFGNYSDGRFGLYFSDVVAIEPIEVSGALGFWKWSPARTIRPLTTTRKLQWPIGDAPDAWEPWDEMADAHTFRVGKERLAEKHDQERFRQRREQNAGQQSAEDTQMPDRRPAPIFDKDGYEILVEGALHPHAWGRTLIHGLERCTIGRCGAARRCPATMQKEVQA